MRYSNGSISVTSNSFLNNSIDAYYQLDNVRNVDALIKLLVNYDQYSYQKLVIAQNLFNNPDNRLYTIAIDTYQDSRYNTQFNEDDVYLNLGSNWWNTVNKMEIFDKIYARHKNYLLPKVLVDSYYSDSNLKTLINDKTTYFKNEKNVIGGILDTEITLDSSKTYFIRNDLIVEMNGKLIINANTTIEMLQNVVVFVKGQLDFLGTQNARINFNLKARDQTSFPFKFVKDETKGLGYFTVNLNQNTINPEFLVIKRFHSNALYLFSKYLFKSCTYLNGYYGTTTTPSSFFSNSDNYYDYNSYVNLPSKAIEYINCPSDASSLADCFIKICSSNCSGYVNYLKCSDTTGSGSSVQYTQYAKSSSIAFANFNGLSYLRPVRSFGFQIDYLNQYMESVNLNDGYIKIDNVNPIGFTLNNCVFNNVNFVIYDNNIEIKHSILDSSLFNIYFQYYSSRYIYYLYRKHNYYYYY